MLGQQVRLKAAARVYVTLHQPDRSPDWVRTADIDWSEFLERLRRGQQRLVDQAPVVAQDGQVAVTTLRVLTSVSQES